MRSVWLLLWLICVADAAAADRWVVSWCSGQQLVEPANQPPAPGLGGNTLRQFVHLSLGGKRLRLDFSNLYGTTPLELISVHIALSGQTGAIRSETDKAVQFAGQASASVPPGQVITSDALEFELPALATTAVSVCFGQVPQQLTGHPGSRTTSYLQTGNCVAAERLTSGAKTAHWYFLSGLDVLDPRAAASVVVLGDSITDGRGSTTDGNDRWTDYLAARLAANGKTRSVGVVNQGIGGNAVLAGGLGPTALERFNRDVLEQPGVKWLILLEGVNDIGRSRNSDVVTNLIAAFRRFAAEAHAHDLRAYAAPILPFGNSMYSSPAHEAARQAINHWIRTSHDFDQVIDLDAAVRDPRNPASLLREFDCGDHLHLNPAGYERMAQTVDLSLFKP